MDCKDALDSVVSVDGILDLLPMTPVDITLSNVAVVSVIAAEGKITCVYCTVTGFEVDMVSNSVIDGVLSMVLVSSVDATLAIVVGVMVTGDTLTFI